MDIRLKDVRVVGKDAYFPFELQFRVGRSNDCSFIPLRLDEAKGLAAQMLNTIKAMESSEPTGLAHDDSDEWVYKRLAGR